ncbi:hypothetical protein ACFOTA_18130 [Chitinophaga sp. GCM10012297]|uniref:Baseplate J-like protein n=1 Tax=Chitinophaga chungangae TaxID=2821488 RepID=A0ABS3YHH0_9BACT|nr:hypothetical protein [Chitinophaga chungangae]MBO9154139.1 hypothetical protein [Chitinophaga chungangae]
MGNKLFYILDNFCPAAYYDKTAIDNKDFFIIVNTYLITDFPECPPLANYIDPATQGTGHVWEYLGANSAAFGRLVPVPPPLNTAISFAYNGTSFDNKLGFEFQDKTEMISWLERSNSFLLLEPANHKIAVDFFKYVSFSQFRELNDWLIALLSEVLKKKTGDITDPLEKKIWDCAWAGGAADFKEKFREKILAQQNAIPPEKPVPLGISDSYIARFCALLKANGLENEQSPFLPPSSKFTSSALALLGKNATDATVLLGDENHYRKILCQRISTEKGQPEKLRERLGLFYGAGERSRINRPPGISIMQIKDIDSPAGMQLDKAFLPTDWLETNAVSLCGQVCAIPLAAMKEPGFFPSLQIKAGSVDLLAQLSPDQRQEYFNAISAYLHNIANNDHTKFKRILSLPEQYRIPRPSDPQPLTVAQEKTRYSPVNVLLKHNLYPIKPAADAYATAIKIPEALLDSLLPAARVSYREDGSADPLFITLNPQRQLLRKEDLFKKEGTPDVKHIDFEGSVPPEQFTPALMFGIQVKKVPLPENGKQAFKLSRKAPVPKNNTDPSNKPIVDELKLLRELLYEPGDIFKKNDFLLLVIKNTIPESPILITNAWTDKKVDDDEMLEIYSEGLQALFADSNAQTVKDTVDADLLIFPVQNIQQVWEKGFNVLLHKDAGKSVFIALDQHYNFRFNTSVNGFSRSMLLTLDKNGFADSGMGDIEPALVDYSNFSKFRISVANGHELKMNTSDALLPVYEMPSTGMPQLFYYRTTHRFSEEINNAENAMENQENRYRLYRLNSAPMTARVKIENQYAFRMALEMDGIAFPFSNPIRNLASLKTSQVTADNVTQVLPLLTYSLTENGSKIQLNLDKKYLVKLLRDKDTEKEALITIYKDLYESFFDAMQNKVSLVLEIWNFNNTIRQVAAEEAAHPEKSDAWPAIVGNMQLVESIPFPKDLTELLSPFDKPSFSEFCQAVKDYIDSGTTRSTSLDLPAEVVKMVNDCNLVRLGLDITREKEHTVFQQFTAGQPADADLKPFPLKDEDDLAADLAFSRPSRAKVALRQYLDDASGQNNLYRSFSYICSEWYDQKKSRKLALTGEPANMKEILGETTPFVWKPEVDAPNKTDMLLYYVPYSFRPLQVHPDLLDLKTTISFAEYLLRVLSWLAYPERQKEDPANFLVNIEPGSTKEELFNARLAARDKILPPVAQKLAELLTYVDNRRSAPTGGHYQLAQEISERIAPEVLKAFISTMRQDPMKYITAKGFGLGLFSGVSTKHLEAPPAPLPKDGVLQDLYGLQLTRDIRPTERQSALPDNLKGGDTARISFKSILQNTSAAGKDYFFIEPLEDALYDNEFQIAEKGNAASSPFPAAQARTAEDLLENINRFNEQQPAGKPARIAVAHYCPDWVTAGNQKFYLLPSRRPPATPVPYIPESVMLRKNADTDLEWQELVLDPSKEIVLRFTTKGDAAGAAGQDGTITLESKFLAKNKDLDQIKIKHWPRWDIFMNTYDFILESDEEGGINNDLLEIYLEENLPASTAQHSATTRNVTQNLLFAQYDYYVRKNGAVPVPIPLAHLLPGGGSKGLIAELLEGILVPGAITATPVADISLYQDSNDGQPLSFKLKIAPGAPMREKVLTAEIFREKSSGNGPVKYLVRVKVLADPWTCYRCRLRVRRNMRDVGGDGGFDINPAFELNSAYSNWVDYGQQTLSYNYLTDLKKSPSWAPGLKYLVPDMSLTTYRQHLREKTEILFGDMVNRHLESHKTLFHPDNIRDNQRFCSAYIEERIRPGSMQIYHPDRHRDDILEYTKTATDKLARAGIGKVPYGQFVANFKIIPDTIHSHEPLIHVSWFSKNAPEKEVFSVMMKLKFEKI